MTKKEKAGLGIMLTTLFTTLLTIGDFTVVQELLYMSFFIAGWTIWFLAGRGE